MKPLILSIYTPKPNGQVVPMITSPVAAGFPSPAEEYLGDTLSVDEYLIDNNVATFYIRVAEGSYSMHDLGIMPNDILVIDRSKEPVHGDVVIGVMLGEFTVKEIDLSRRGRVRLVPRSSKHQYPAIEITEEMDFSVWGVVTGRFGRIGRFKR